MEKTINSIPRRTFRGRPKLLHVATKGRAYADRNARFATLDDASLDANTKAYSVNAGELCEETGASTHWFAILVKQRWHDPTSNPGPAKSKLSCRFVFSRGFTLREWRGTLYAQTFVHTFSESIRSSASTQEIPMAITLKEVAGAAGVSVSVASRSLSGQAQTYRIHKDTEARVKLAAEKLGFRPSHVARSLQSQKTGLIGIVVPELTNPFFAYIARSITLAAEQLGLSVIVADSREETEHELRLVKQLEDRQVEALVVCPVGRSSTHLLEVQDRGTPMVLVDRTFPDEPVMQVTSAHHAGALKATQFLINMSHRVIGVLQGLPGTLPNQQRLDAYRHAVRAAGITCDETLIAGDNFSEQSGYQSARQLLEMRSDITALFAFSTPNAMGGMRAAMELGVSVPDDLSFIAFDDSPYANLMQVPLTTVCQDVETLGNKAASLVIAALSKTKSRWRKTYYEVPARLIRRNSVKKVS